MNIGRTGDGEKGGVVLKRRVGKKKILKGDVRNWNLRAGRNGKLMGSR